MDVPPGMLISVLQRGLQYSALEQHINEDGSERECTRGYNLLQPHTCDPLETALEEAAATSTAATVKTGGISQEVDAPIQSTISTLNLALQNASIMATNAVYGSSTISTQTSASSTTSATTTTNTTTTTATTGRSGPVSKKKKKEASGGGAAAVEIKREEDVFGEWPNSSSATSVPPSSNTTTTNNNSTSFASSSFGDDELLELIGHQSEVIGVAWSPQSNLLATASGDSTVRLWSFPSNAEGLYEVNPRSLMKNARVLEHVLIKDLERNSDVTCLEWRRDGLQLVTGCYDGKARVWSSQGDLQKTLQRHVGPIFAVRWSPQGRFLLTTGIDGAAIVWDVDGGGCRYYLPFHSNSSCLDADWRTEGQFVTSGADRVINFYDLSLAPVEGSGDDFVPACQLIGHTDEVNTVKFDPSGKILASCSDDGSVRLWRIESNSDARGEAQWHGKEIKRLYEHSQQVYSLKWASDKVFATASFDCTVKIWKISEGLEENSSETNSFNVTSMTLSQHSKPVYAVSFSPCGRFLASGSLDENIIVWDVERGVVLKSYAASGSGGIFDLEWTRCNDEANGNEMAYWIAAGNADGRVIILEYFVASTIRDTADFRDEMELVVTEPEPLKSGADAMVD